MRRSYILSIILVAGLPSIALAQSSANGARPGNEIGTGNSLPLGTTASNISPANTRSTIAPNLPSPALPPTALPSDMLRAAEGALAAGRTGEAQQALEMAQTRMLDRTVPLGQTNNPSDNPTVGQIARALQALSVNDRSASLTAIEAAIGSARTQGL